MQARLNLNNKERQRKSCKHTERFKKLPFFGKFRFERRNALVEPLACRFAHWRSVPQGQFRQVQGQNLQEQQFPPAKAFKPVMHFFRFLHSFLPQLCYGCLSPKFFAKISQNASVRGANCIIRTAIGAGRSSILSARRRISSSIAVSVCLAYPEHARFPVSKEHTCTKQNSCQQCAHIAASPQAYVRSFTSRPFLSSTST